MALRTDSERTAHLLRRFGLGASEREVDFYSSGGWRQAVERLLNYEVIPEAIDLDVQRFRQGNQRFVPMPLLQAWWMGRMLTTRRPLQEKMTLFWHDHFATSAIKVTNSAAMHAQNELLRRHATGRFPNLLLEISRDPAMIYWLDNQYNVKASPNENFARELMELFTLGIGHYSEEDVYEVARAFTGWGFGLTARRRPPEDRVPALDRFIFYRDDYDDGEKTIRGRTGRWSGEDVIQHLCADFQTARFLTTKLWTWFVYEDPDPDLIEAVARQFYRTGLDIRAVLREIMTHDEFYSDRAERAVIKNPIDFIVPTIRQLGHGEIVAERLASLPPDEPFGRAALGGFISPAQVAASMGMALFFPPDVAGWDHGAAWITTATMVERIKWADRLFAPVGGSRLSLRIPVQPILGLDRRPAQIVERFVSVFDAPVTPAQHAELIELVRRLQASGGLVTPRNAAQLGTEVTRLLFAAPEFQMA